MEKINVLATFDNGGGLTLQLGSEFAHNYDDMVQAANDYKVYLADGNTDGWQGNQEELIDLEVEYDQILNGGYKVLDYDDIQYLISEYKSITDDDEKKDWGFWGHNVSVFIIQVSN